MTDWDISIAPLPDQYFVLKGGGWVASRNSDGSNPFGTVALGAGGGSFHAVVTYNPNYNGYVATLHGTLASDCTIGISNAHGTWSATGGATGQFIARPLKAAPSRGVVSGRVTEGGRGVGGISVRANCAGGGTRTTDRGGYYSFTLDPGSCVISVVPTSGLTVTPKQRVVQVGTQDISGVDFVLACGGGAGAAVKLKLHAGASGSESRFTLTATNHSRKPVGCVTVSADVFPAFNVKQPTPAQLSPTGATVSWGEKRGTITWSNVSLPAGGSQEFNYALQNQQVAAATGQVLSPVESWIDWQKPLTPEKLTAGGGQLIVSDSPEDLRADMLQNGTAAPRVEGVLYRQPAAETPAATAPGGAFRLFSLHLNDSQANTVPQRSQPPGQTKQFFWVFYNPGPGAVTLKRGITAEEVTSLSPDATKPEQEYMSELAHRHGDTSCTHTAGTIPAGKALALRDGGAVPPTKLITSMDDFCAAGGKLRVGEAVLNADTAGRFEADPLLYQFEASGGNFLTAAELPSQVALGHYRGTFPRSELDVTLPPFDVETAARVGWPIAPHAVSDPQYDEEKDTSQTDPSTGGPIVNRGNYGVLYHVKVRVEHGSSTTPVQVLLNPRGGPFGASVLTSASPDPFFFYQRCTGTKDHTVCGLGVGAGRIPGTQSDPFEFSLIPPAATSLPVGAILAPSYVGSDAKATFDGGTASSEKAFAAIEPAQQAPA